MATRGIDADFVQDLEIEYLHLGGNSFDDGYTHVKTAPCIIIAQTLRGSYEVIRDGESATVKEGEFFLAGTNDDLTIIHHGRGERMEARWIHTRCSIRSAFLFERLYVLPGVVRGKEAREMSGIFDGIERLGKEVVDVPSVLLRKELGFRLLRMLCGISQVDEQGWDECVRGRRFMPLIEWINANLARDLVVEDLAEAAHLSPSRLHAAFREAFALAPMAYLKNIRLAKARQMLLMNEKSLYEIAEETGFKNQFHFSREFKNRFGISPSKYRNEKGQLVV
ncbi:MAG: helix-turn-helix transcriptional regulator [Planctomycetes bacterium]|nr:helix-turn-helix transcriptional regulator [Planctomycetota bacterium]